MLFILGFSSTKVSVIIPCYNEEEVIEKTYQEVKNVMNCNNYDHEIAFVDEGSRDRRLEILRSIALRNDKAVILSFSRNFGHQLAVPRGIKHCSSDVTITTAVDPQNPPQVIPEMIETHIEHTNGIYSVKKERKEKNFLKKFTTKSSYRLLNVLSDVKFALDTGDFRVTYRKVSDEFKKLKERGKYTRRIINWMGFNQILTCYDRNPRPAGKTEYSLKKMARFALSGIFYFSDNPPMIATILGFVTTVIGFGSAVRNYLTPSDHIWSSIYDSNNSVYGGYSITHY